MPSLNELSTSVYQPTDHLDRFDEWYGRKLLTNVDAQVLTMINTLISGEVLLDIPEVENSRELGLLSVGWQELVITAARNLQKKYLDERAARLLRQFFGEPVLAEELGAEPVAIQLTADTEKSIHQTERAAGLLFTVLEQIKNELKFAILPMIDQLADKFEADSNRAEQTYRQTQQAQTAGEASSDQKTKHLSRIEKAKIVFGHQTQLFKRMRSGLEGKLNSLTNRFINVHNLAVDRVVENLNSGLAIPVSV